jgi:hypothetical protein
MNNKSLLDEAIRTIGEWKGNRVTIHGAYVKVKVQYRKIKGGRYLKRLREKLKKSKDQIQTIKTE